MTFTFVVLNKSIFILLKTLIYLFELKNKKNCFGRFVVLRLKHQKVPKYDSILLHV